MCNNGNSVYSVEESMLIPDTKTRTGHSQQDDPFLHQNRIGRTINQLLPISGDGRFGMIHRQSENTLHFFEMVRIHSHCFGNSGYLSLGSRI